MSVIQTSLGHLASSYFSKEWNTKVKIGGISLNIFNHVSLYDVELVHPNGDLIVRSKEIRCRFNSFPVSGSGLNVDRVYVGETVFNLKKYEDGLNLTFIIDYFKSNKPKDDDPSKPFPIKVKELVLKNVEFSLDMTNGDTSDLKTYGVQVKNMTYKNINASIQNISIVKDSIYANFRHFSTTEKSGFELSNLQMEASVCSKGIKAKNARIITPTTNLLFDAELKYRDWKTMGSYIDSVQMDAHIKKGSYGNFTDAGYWADVLWGIDEKAYISGHFSGTVANLKSDKFEISFGEKTHLTGNGSIVGLPNIYNTIINGSVHDMRTNMTDFYSSKFLQRFAPIKLPDFTNKVGDILLNAEFYGKINDFAAKANLKSDLGFIDTEIALKHDSKINDYVYGGVLHLKNFQLKDIFNTTIAERTNLDVEFKGSGTNIDNIDAELVGKSNDFMLFGNQYDSLDFNFKAQKKNFDANLSLFDNSIHLTFDGNVDLNSKENASYNFVASIQNAHLGELNLFEPRDFNSVLSTNLNVNFTGNSVDNFSGYIKILNTHYTENDKHINIDSIDIQAKDLSNSKNITIRSNIFDFDMQGHFHFRKFGLLVNQFLDNYVPQYFHRQSFVNLLDTLGTPDFNFNLTLKNTQELAAIFIPSLSVSNNTTFTGNYTSEGGLSTTLLSDSIKFTSLDFRNIKMETKEENEAYSIDFHTQNLTTAELIPLENVNCKILSQSEGFDIKLDWKDTLQTSMNNGFLNIVGHTEPFLIKAFFKESNLVVNGEKWDIAPSNLIRYSDTDLNISDLDFNSNEQRISINSEISSDGADEISLDFKDFKLEQLNVLMKQAGLECKALVNGTFFLHETQKTPFFKSNLLLKNTIINGEKFGEASIIASLDSKNDRIKLDLTTSYTGNSSTIQPIQISGYFYPGNKTNNYDFSVKFQNFKLKTVEGYVKSFADKLEGNLSGDLFVKGKLAEPQISGDLAFALGKIKINFLNTTYNFSDKIKITNDSFVIDNFNLIDPAANSAKIQGKITHNHFSDFNFDLNLDARNFMFLNTSAQSGNPYYGKVFADGNVTIKGALNDLTMSIKAKTMKGTDVFIPVSSKMEVSQNKFVHFVSKDTTEQAAKVEEQTPLNLKMTIDLEATPDAKISLPLNFDQMTGDLSASGKGNLRLLINTLKNDFKMYGNYEIATGSFKLNLLNIVEKPFELEKGGTIVWTGDPTNAALNVSGIYNTKASLSPLLSQSGAQTISGESYQKPINVQSVIIFSGMLANPKISFDIRLPHVDQSTQDLVFSIIDKNNQNQMVEQTVSLLLINQFSSEGSNNSNYGNVGISTLVETMSSQLGNTLANPYVDIGVSYKTGESGSNTSDQFDVNFSKDLGKWYYEGSVGMGINSNNSTTTTTSSNSNKYSLEFLLGYKITESVHIQTYNRQNTNEFTREESPYVQGIGLIYQKEFDKISEIFKKKTKVIKDEKTN